MYKFRDTPKRKHQSEHIFIPTSAMIYKGTFIERLIEGYQTLSVEGREMYSLNHEMQELQYGGIITNTKLPARVLTIKYKLEDKDSESLQNKFDELMAFLFSGEDVLIQFNDDLEYFFKGRYQAAEQVPGDTNSIISTFTVICGDPYKYGKEQVSTGKILGNLPYPVKPESMKVIMNTGFLDITDGKYHLKASNIKKGDVLFFDFKTGDIWVNGKLASDILNLDSDFKNIRLRTGSNFSDGNYDIEIKYRKAVL
ncbi:distal tail protein Dit [Lactococcus sp. DD01]|uniref:distal tail protein Dit n=1 Tax=Lactococcus sp. DD01 TaxID=1776443 RepID=UPI0007762F9C|nr:distal tail protein Dit [Lactococcus sp. DD01]KXT61476.1 Phage capsid and scaffold [Lactococcus sp. DD01]